MSSAALPFEYFGDAPVAEYQHAVGDSRKVVVVGRRDDEGATVPRVFGQRHAALIRQHRCRRGEVDNERILENANDEKAVNETSGCRMGPAGR